MANGAAAAFLAALAVAIALTLRGDRACREVELLVAAILEAEEQVQEEDADSSEDLERVRRLLPAAQAEASRRLESVADRALPIMWFAPHVAHTYCFNFAHYALRHETYALARRFAETALRLHPTDQRCVTFLAQMDLNEDRIEQAVARLEPALELFGYNPNLFLADQLALAYRRQGDERRADEVLRKAAELEATPPENPTPPNQARDVPRRPRLDWNDCPTARSYAVYLWEEGTDRPPHPQIAGLRASEARLPFEAKPDTTYFWRVKAIGRHGDEASSDTWLFRTAGDERESSRKQAR
jgi:tetratricopeptide (TPR) repeat protein